MIFYEDIFIPKFRSQKMMINPLPNDRIPKPKKGQYATIAVKTLSTRINVECEESSSISQ